METHSPFELSRGTSKWERILCIVIPPWGWGGWNKLLYLHVVLISASVWTAVHEACHGELASSALLLAKRYPFKTLLCNNKDTA